MLQSSDWPTLKSQKMASVDKKYISRNFLRSVVECKLAQQTWKRIWWYLLKPKTCLSWDKKFHSLLYPRRNSWQMKEKQKRQGSFKVKDIFWFWCTYEVKLLMRIYELDVTLSRTLFPQITTWPAPLTFPGLCSYITALGLSDHPM